jgi:murein DD-endopeptidase MepM/ murein hydrolase activator NlpD
VASTPLPGGSRHVGRVIDPSVRDDGEPEPAVELEAERPSDVGEPVPDVSSQPALPRGARARDALLERAAAQREAEAVDAAQPLGNLDEVGRSEGESGPDAETDALPSRAPSVPLGAPLGRLSPNQVALFSTLLGVATVASLIALGMNFDVRPAARHSEPAASAAVPSAAVEEPAPPPKAKRARTKVPGPWRIADARGDAKLRIIEGKIGPDAFLKALEKAGVQTKETYRVLTAMKGVRDFDHCKSSDRFAALIERGSSKLKAFEYIASAEEVYQAREGDDGFLKGAKLDLAVERNEISAALVYDGKSFDASAEQAGLEHGLGKVVAKALDGQMALDELERGSRIRVIAQEVVVLGEFARYSGVEAVEIRSPDPSKPPFRVYYFAAEAERGYFDADGHSPYEGGWRKPIPDARMTSPYNLTRMHPILKKVMPHLGIDFGAPMGTPVGAASYGTVSFASYIGPTGNLVRIDHANGIQTGYAHLSRFAEGLKVGDKVKRLQLIGYVGSTGRSTGPHLHFSARKNGDFIDPASLNLDAMRTLSKENRGAFAEVKARYDAKLDAITLPEPLRGAAPTPAAAESASAAPPVAAAPSASEPAAARNAGNDPGDDEEEDTGTPNGAPPSGSPSPAAAGPPATEKSGKAVYLTDKELLKLQGATDEGEVVE